MSPTFTDDDVGKTVETAEGRALGVVTGVDRETAYVDPKQQLTDSIKATLDWETGAEDAVPLAADAVQRITDDAVRLEPGFLEESLTTGSDEDGADRSEEPEAGTPEGEVESGGGESATGANADADVDESDRGPETDDVGDPGPGMDDLDDVDDAGLTDTATEIDGDEERGTTGGGDPIEAFGGSDDRDPAEEIDSVESESESRDLEVDPTELTDDDPEVEIRPEEDVGDRTDPRDEPVRSGGSTRERNGSGTAETETGSESERESDVGAAEERDNR